jgi:Cdc6-like AAA superfamily ATPase
MKPMFFVRFDPHAVHPSLIVHRGRELDWFVGSLDQYLGLDGPPEGRVLCLTGQKGVGKSILTREAIRRLRESHSSNTLFVEINCQRCDGWRDVLRDVASATLKELNSLRDATAPVTPELLATAKILATLSGFTDVELKTVHEHLLQHSLAAGLRGKQKLLSFLELNFDISLQRSETSTKNITGTVRFDEDRLSRALCALFEDLRSNHLNVVVYLDNLDELRHEYGSESVLQQVRHEVEGVLRLSDAPIALVVNVRSYFGGVLPRALSNRKILRCLEASQLPDIIELRIGLEPDEVRARIATPDAVTALNLLAGIASTPCAFLVWFHWLFQEDLLSVKQLKAGLFSFVESRYATLPLALLHRVGEAFPVEPDVGVDKQTILNACGRNESILSQLGDRQAILPVDFWHPNQFTLDPELRFLQPTILNSLG